MISNKSQLRKMKRMTNEMLDDYMATATKITVAKVERLVDGNFRIYYVAKIRGVGVGEPGTLYHATADAARAYGKSVLASWQAK